MKPNSLKKYNVTTAKEVQSFIDLMLTKTVVEKKGFDATLIIPSHIVLENTDSPGTRLVVKFESYWDGDLEDAERENDKLTN